MNTKTKTAISVDGALLLEVDRAAGEIGVSRSRLISIALEDYLRDRRNQAILDQLNSVYGDETAKTDKRLTAGMKARFRQVIQSEW